MHNKSVPMDIWSCLIWNQTTGPSKSALFSLTDSQAEVFPVTCYPHLLPGEVKVSTW